MASAHPDLLTFKIHPADGGSEVPVSVLTQSLSTLQELILLFALHEEGGALRQRLRLSEELKTHYVLHCRPPQPGSFAVTARVGSRGGRDLFPHERIVKVVGNLNTFARAAVAGEEARLTELLPDSRLRNRALSRLINLSPTAGSGYRHELGNGVGPLAVLDESLSVRIEAWLKSPAERAEIQTVTGRLEAISFSDHKVTIHYAPKGRWLECIYEDDVEPMLLENPRGLIQVTGRVVSDEEGHPRKIVEVEEIREVDLSPFVVDVIPVGRGAIQARSAVSLTPVLSESEQFLCLEHPAWDLDVFAPTRQELVAELREQLAMLWMEYATEDDAALSEPALRLKAALLTDFREVQHA
jgi:hypothetical protein